MLGKQPYSKWNELDYILLEAFQLYEDEMVKEVGLPYWMTRSIDPDIQFIVDERYDAASAALSLWNEAESNRKKKKKRHGIMPMVVAVDASGQPLVYGGLKRQDFHLAASQEARDLLEVDVEIDRPEGGYNPADHGDGVTNPA